MAICLLGLAVITGAFGAHGLEKVASAKLMKTFETGVRYHFFQCFGLLGLALYQEIKGVIYHRIYMTGLFGMVIFSFNCYLYVITGVKTFAMIVPIGGFMMIGFWFAWANKIRKEYV